MMRQRLFTQWAADQIEATLIKKDALGYTPWEDLTHAQRWQAIQREWIEVQEALSPCCLEEKRTPEAVAHLQAELCDLAITAMMMAGCFDEKVKQLKRGRRKDNERNYF